MENQVNKISKETLGETFFTVNFFRRVITALLLGGLTLWILISESPYIGFFISFLAFLILIEWGMVVFKSDKPHNTRILWLFLGVTYLLLGIFGFYQLYEYSALLGISLLLLIWSTDIGAYFAGKIIGGPKLAPSISPNKTWSGAIGGTLSASTTALIISAYLYEGFNWPMVAFLVLCSILGQVGDLLESRIKRHFKIKDSGKILPGHGGLIDRLDSLLFVGIFLFIFYSIIGFATIFNL
ncbi:MAG TPA: phosphatidate cytidylyltransferase [Holosporales bacterium]|nr:phosphatidate cytidylyltransferase [Holosporales bacterium]